METELKYTPFDRDLSEKLAAAIGCHPVIGSLLAGRGITDAEAARDFLNPRLDTICNPFDLADMDRACDRILTAITLHEKILVFGDFDADGVTATALLHEFLSLVEADVTWYIPHRAREGYSFQEEHARMAVRTDIDLVITVDCGITSHRAVEIAVEEDIDVIVTDHHEPQATLPRAFAVIDPKRPDCQGGLDFLAGVGVAFFLVMALRKRFREEGFWERFQEPSLIQFLDLFAIGTIGDMVPLVRENRMLCMAGLRQIQRGTRPGIRALAQAARIDLKQVDSDDISYKLVPRINAAGRISHARICVSHLTASQLAQASTTADLLDQLNIKRQQIEREILWKIEHRLTLDPALLSRRVLVLWDRDWDPAVLGIVASRLSKKHSRPVVLLRVDGDTAVGSCRSVNQINIHEALSAQDHLLEKFGGHAMAAGLTLKADHLEALQENLAAYLEQRYSDSDFQKNVLVDAELSLPDITLDLAREVHSLRPFGTANPEPLFLCRNVRVASSAIIGGHHRKMTLTSGTPGTVVDAMQFNLEDTRELPSFFSRVLFRLKLNKFRAEALQLIIEDL